MTVSDHPFRVGDPVVDLAQGRPMVVLAAPDETVREWSDREGYDLMDNYANSKFSPTPDEPVVECVYVSDVRSEPSKSYTFPVSRCCLIDAHHADDGRRLYERVARDVLETLIVQAGDDFGGDDSMATLARRAGLPEDLVDEARELAHVETHVGGDE
jgi:hypothetical protein